MWFRRAFIGSAFLLGITVCSFAQETTGRKPVKSDPPAYPEMARKLNLTGAVKLEVTINPNGTVKSTKVKGGNPVLAAAAQSSVKNWTYEPGSTETTALVTINFKAP
jgi:TonB family protein